jgi:hypothetical protein
LDDKQRRAVARRGEAVVQLAPAGEHIGEGDRRRRVVGLLPDVLAHRQRVRLDIRDQNRNGRVENALGEVVERQGQVAEVKLRSTPFWVAIWSVVLLSVFLHIERAPVRTCTGSEGGSSGCRRSSRRIWRTSRHTGG